VKRNTRKIFFIFIITGCALFLYEELMIFIIITLYVLGSLVYMLTHKEKLKDIFDWEKDKVDGEQV